MFLKCWSLHVCENLSKQSVKWRKAVNEIGGNILGENFLVGKFPGMGEFSRGGGLRWDFFGSEFSRGNFPRTIFLIQCIYSYFSKDYQQIL